MPHLGMRLCAKWGIGRWTMDDGRWTMDDGRCLLNRPWSIVHRLLGRVGDYLDELVLLPVAVGYAAGDGEQGVGGFVHDFGKAEGGFIAVGLYLGGGGGIIYAVWVGEVGRGVA